MLAEMRTGSNFLEANLNAFDGITCHGELFNPHFIGKKDQEEFLGITLDQREKNPLDLLDKLRASEEGLVGFRYFHDHDPRILPIVLQDHACAKIILTRNPIESYVSWKIAQATGQWKLTNAKNLKSAKVSFDAAEFEDYLRDLQEFQIALMNGLQTSGQTAFYIDYDDLNDLNVINGLAQFLGLTQRLEALDDKLKKQNPEPLAEKLLNADEMEAALARLDRFNLSRTPNFEPRRPPAVPSFIASDLAPLIYMPLRSGPETEVKTWLQGFGGELVGDFVQKTLRQWKKAHPGHRSFTVLRHPLLRGYAAFQQRIASGLAMEHRNRICRMFEVEIPKGGAFASPEAEHAAFLAFLRYAKLATSGQLGAKVDPHWASQAAVLQGFAQFFGPDLILREDQLASGLRYLAKEVGLKAPDYQPDPSLTRLGAHLRQSSGRGRARGLEP